MFYNFLQFFFNFPLKVLIFVIFFTIPLARRRFFFPRAFTIGVLYISAFYFIPLFGYLYDVVLFLLSVVWIFCCFRCTPYTMIFCAVGAFAGQHISFYCFRIVQILTQLPSNGLPGLMISTALCVAVAVGTYFLLVRNIDYSTLKKSKSILFNSVVILSLTILCGESIPAGNDTTNLLYCIYAVVSCSLALAVQYGIFRRRELEMKNEEIERIMYAERKQREISRQSIEMLNMRCHDLKHQVDLLRSTDSSNRRGELIDELKKTIDEYDSVIRTGLEVLDTVLTEKNYVCRNKGIIFSYIVDGEKLAFMSDADVYTLFGNALENAIEALEGVEREKRIVSLSAIEKQGCVYIRVENYCDKEPTFANGLPVSSKSGGLHGYGTKSIRYISEKYNGVATMVYENGWFRLNILLPVP